MCFGNSIGASNSEETTLSANPAASPPVHFKRKFIYPGPDEHLKHSMASDPIGFCHECAYHCMRKKLKPFSCGKFECRCALTGYV